MAKQVKVKARKEYKCFCCGAVIRPGDEYYDISGFKFRGFKRCLLRPAQRWEMTTSEYYQRAWQLIDTWRDNYTLESGVLDDIKSELEDMQSEYEDKMSNLEENNLENSPVGETVQERLDAITSAYDDLDSLEEPEEWDEDELDETEFEFYEDDIGTGESKEQAKERQLEEWKQSKHEEWEEENRQAWEDLAESIDDALSNLDV